MKSLDIFLHMIYNLSMSCYHPITAFWTGCYTETGKKQMYISKYDVDCISEESLAKAGVPYLIYPAVGEVRNGHFFFTQKYELPCGKCIGCDLDRSKIWAMRCVKEASLYPEGYNWFVTLTYDDKHLSSPYLVKEDLKKFMKKLRRRMQYHGFAEDGIRYFGCGEYGEKYQRPHFHVILFNCPLPDVEVVGKNPDIERTYYYHSDIVQDCWNKGFTTLGNVTFDSCAYVARYVIKKHKQEELFSDIPDFVPEFIQMSRRPGIAAEWYEQNKDKIYETDEVLMTSRLGKLIKLKPCRFFDNKYDIENPEKMADIKANRQRLAAISQANLLYKTHHTHVRYLRAQQEKQKLQSAKKLVRRIEKNK